MQLKFTWNPAKAEKNLREHGVSFTEAATAFGDKFGRYRQDKDHWDRAILIAKSGEGRVLFVVHIELLDKDTIHIISARKASRAQRLRYEEEQDE